MLKHLAGIGVSITSGHTIAHGGAWRTILSLLPVYVLRAAELIMRPSLLFLSDCVNCLLQPGVIGFNLDEYLTALLESALFPQIGLMAAPSKNFVLG
eukprot:3815465-Amphidinium_carterae.1